MLGAGLGRITAWQQCSLGRQCWDFRLSQPLWIYHAARDVAFYPCFYLLLNHEMVLL